MAKRSKTAKPKPGQSTAAIFADEQSRKAVEQPAAPVAKPPVENDDPRSYAFPLNYIFQAQDFANDHMNFCKFVQILVLGYITQVFYLTDVEKLKKLAPLVGFNVLGVVLGLVLTYTSTLKKYTKEPERLLHPVMPEFELMYAIYLPAAYSLVTDSRFLVVNLALNYAVVENLHPLAKFASSVMFYEVYNTEERAPTTYYVALAFFYYLFTTSIAAVNQGSDNTKTQLSKEVLELDDIDSAQVSNNTSGVNVTLSKTEIHLLGVFVVNLLFNATSEAPVPVVIFQKLVVSLLGSTLLSWPLYKLYSAYPYKLGVPVLAGAFGAAFYYATNFQLEPVLGAEPLVWLYDYIRESEFRVQVLTAWVGALVILVPTVYFLSNTLALNTRRKVWHYVLLGSIAYPLVADRDFTALALFGLLLVFVVVEFLRSTRFTFVGQFLYDQLKIFQDFKDLKGPLNLSYIFLVVGVTIPVAYDLIYSDATTITSYIGIITLGVGDSFASVVGRKYGSIKWRSGTKSIQGTAAFFVSTAAAFYAVDKYLLVQKVTNWENLLISTFLAALVEGTATLNDNFLIPVVTLLGFQVISTLFP